MVEKTVDTPPKERLPSSEIFSTADIEVGLQVRLILGGKALKPTIVDLPKVENNQLSGISTETYKILQQASTHERNDYWQKKGDQDTGLQNFDAQMESWSQNLVKYVNNPKAEQRKNILGNLLLDESIDWQNFGQKDATTIFNRYFRSPDGYALFVQDILTSYKESGGINFARLNQDLPEIKKLALIFGENSSEIMDSVIQASGKLATPEKKQELITQVNETQTVDQSPTTRLNSLNQKEKTLLTWLTQDLVIQEPQEPEIKFEIQNVDIVVSYDQNRKAADQYISILRDPRRLKPNPEFEEMLIHDYGFVFDRREGGTYLDTDLMARRYQLPIAIYTNHLIPSIPHANLVLKGPHLDPLDNRWKIFVYDPYQLDMHEVALENVHSQGDALDAQKTSISYNHLWKEEYLNQQEDISFTDDEELAPFRNALVNAKLAPFQQDMINCLPYCYFVGSMLNALKPGQTNFKTQGIPQFLKDYYLQIITREEFLAKQQSG